MPNLYIDIINKKILILLAHKFDNQSKFAKLPVELIMMICRYINVKYNHINVIPSKTLKLYVIGRFIIQQSNRSNSRWVIFDMVATKFIHANIISITNKYIAYKNGNCVVVMDIDGNEIIKYCFGGDIIVEDDYLILLSRNIVRICNIITQENYRLHIYGYPKIYKYNDTIIIEAHGYYKFENDVFYKIHFDSNIIQNEYKLHSVCLEHINGRLNNKTKEIQYYINDILLTSSIYANNTCVYKLTTYP